jgi:hypothetical protein
VSRYERITSTLGLIRMKNTGEKKFYRSNPVLRQIFTAVFNVLSSMPVYKSKSTGEHHRPRETLDEYRSARQIFNAM